MESMTGHEEGVGMRGIVCTSLPESVEGNLVGLAHGWYYHPIRMSASILLLGAGCRLGVCEEIHAMDTHPPKGNGSPLHIVFILLFVHLPDAYITVRPTCRKMIQIQIGLSSLLFHISPRLLLTFLQISSS